MISQSNERESRAAGGRHRGDGLALLKHREEQVFLVVTLLIGALVGVTSWRSSL